MPASAASTCRSRPCRSSSSPPSFRPRTRTSTSMPASIRRVIVRAVVANLRSRAAGASRAPRRSPSRSPRTSCVGSEKSYERKIREALIALRIEATFSKDKILELYLNEIFLGPDAGRNLHGIAAAALDYFGKSVHELTIAEAAYLAALAEGAEQLSSLPPDAGGDRAPQLGHRPHGRERLHQPRGWRKGAKKEPLAVNPRVGLPEQHRLRLLRRGGPPRDRRTLWRADAL